MHYTVEFHILGQSDRRWVVFFLNLHGQPKSTIVGVFSTDIIVHFTPFVQMAKNIALDGTTTVKKNIQENGTAVLLLW